MNHIFFEAPIVTEIYGREIVINFSVDQNVFDNGSWRSTSTLTNTVCCRVIYNIEI